jgi:hypothetical protein
MRQHGALRIRSGGARKVPIGGGDEAALAPVAGFTSRRETGFRSRRAQAFFPEML